MTAAIPQDLTAPSVRAERLRAALIRLVTGLLCVQLIAMSASGPVLVVGGEVPTGMVLAALLAPLAKLLSVGALLAVAWTAARSVLAVQTWVLGQLLWVLTAALVPQPDSGVADQAATLVLFTSITVALRPHRRELLTIRPRPTRGLAVAALPIVLGAVLLARQALGTAAGVGLSAAHVAELRYDMTLLALALGAFAAWAAVRPHRSSLPAYAVALTAALVSAATLLLPSSWANAGPLAAASLAVGAGAMALAATRPDGASPRRLV